MKARNPNVKARFSTTSKRKSRIEINQPSYRLVIQLSLNNLILKRFNLRGRTRVDPVLVIERLQLQTPSSKVHTMTHSNRTYPNRISKFIGSMTVEELKDYLDIDSVDETNGHSKNLIEDEPEKDNDSR